MSTQRVVTPAHGNGRQVPAQARQLAGRLSALFRTDSLIAGRLGDAQRRLTQANDRLWSGLHPDACGLIYDGAAPAGHSKLAELIEDTITTGGLEAQSTVLRALQDVHWTVHKAFIDYQNAAEERRQLAADVGELIREFLDALTEAGWTEAQARNADVHQLAASPRPMADRGKEPGR